jgi:hypothetical protein
MIIRIIKQALSVHYNPDRHTLPDRDKKNRKDTDKDMQQNYADPYSIAGGQIWTSDNEFLTWKNQDGNAKAAWKQTSPKTDNGRTPMLTDRDIEELEARNLKVSTAKQVKPLWAVGVTNDEICSQLKRKYGYGFGKTTVASICGAFSSALSPSSVGEG